MLILAVVGCDPFAVPPMRGVAEMFDVHASMTSNSCGPQSGRIARNVQFRLELSVDQAHVVWHVLDTGVMATGAYTAATRGVRIESESVVQLRAADRRTGRAACVMRRYDVIDGTLSADLRSATDAATGDASDENSMTTDAATDAGGAVAFNAIETVVWGPVANADCSDAIGAGSGQFTVLPCQLQFDMVGTGAR